MSSLANWRDRLRNDFRAVWQQVDDLGQSECQALIECVASRFARPDMARRFLQDFGGARIIGARYFRSTRSRSPDTDASQLPSGGGGGIVRCEVVFNTYREPIGFTLFGASVPLEQLFVEPEGDALGTIRVGKQVTVVFLTQGSHFLELQA